MSSIKITLPLAFVVRQSPPPTPTAITTIPPQDSVAPAPLAQHPLKGALDTAGRLLGGLIASVTAPSGVDPFESIERGLVGEISLGASMDPPGKDADGVFRANLSLSLGVRLMAAWPWQAEAPVVPESASSMGLVQAT
jgi:hypothetical protein